MKNAVVGLVVVFYLALTAAVIADCTAECKSPNVTCTATGAEGYSCCQGCGTNSSSCSACAPGKSCTSGGTKENGTSSCS
jgi:hypothetical protein